MNNIKYKIFQAKQTKEILLCLHGFAGDKESSVIDAIGSSLKNSNITTISFDLPCHGEDENRGIFRVEKCQEYLAEVLKEIKSHTSAPINIFATSFGAYLFLHYLSSSNDKFKNIILRSPAIDMPHIIRKIMKEHGVRDIKFSPINLGYGRELFIDNQFISSLSLPKFDSKNSIVINIIQGRKDELIDCAFNEKYFEKYFNGRHKIYYFDSADHRYKNPGEKEKIVEIVKNILF